MPRKCAATVSIESLCKNGMHDDLMFWLETFLKSMNFSKDEHRREFELFSVEDTQPLK